MPLTDILSELYFISFYFYSMKLLMALRVSRPHLLMMKGDLFVMNHR